MHWLGLRQIKSLTIQFCQRSNSKSWISGNLPKLHWEGTHSLIYLAIWGNVYLLHFLFDFAVIASKFVNQPFWRKNCTICVILMSNREGHEHCTSLVIPPPNIWMRGSLLFSVQAVEHLLNHWFAAKPALGIVDKGPLEIRKIFLGKSPRLLEFNYKP